MHGFSRERLHGQRSNELASPSGEDYANFSLLFSQKPDQFRAFIGSNSTSNCHQYSALS